MSWSFHAYVKTGKSSGFDKVLVRESANRLNRIKTGLPRILSLKHFCVRSGLPFPFAMGIVSRNSSFGYETHYIRKRNNSFRVISVPHPLLKAAQKWINFFVLNQLTPNELSFAFQKNKSIKDCAEIHCGASWLVKLDIKDFFDSITEIDIFRIFSSVGYNKLLAFELARICTRTNFRNQNVHTNKRYLSFGGNKKISRYNNSHLGTLPQGAPTSPALSNLYMVGLDAKLTEVASKYAATYSRYADDMTFSSSDDNFNWLQSKKLIQEVDRIISAKGLKLNTEKTKIITPKQRKEILGLCVNNESPTLKKEFKSKIRQHLYYCQKHGVIDHAARRKFDSPLGFKNHLLGLINFAKMIDNNYAEKCKRQFDAINWPI